MSFDSWIFEQVATTDNRNTAARTDRQSYISNIDTKSSVFPDMNLIRGDEELQLRLGGIRVLLIIDLKQGMK